jgi:hypothetical protein
MYGFKVPRDYDQVTRFDTPNGNKRWQESTSLEMEQLGEYDVFQDLGKDGDPGAAFKKIRLHLIFAVK